MIKIAEYLSPQPTLLWKLVKQVGVDYALGALPYGETTAQEIGFEGVLRPAHVPTMEGEPNDHPGYAVLGRLFAIGYLKGLCEAVYGRTAKDNSDCAAGDGQ